MGKVNLSKSELYVKIAKMYYLENMSQGEISNILQMSRSNISRILSKCIENNIVHISINDDFSRSPEISYKLKKMFGLKDVFIAPSGGSERACAKNVAALANKYLNKIIRDDMLLGIAGGEHLLYMAQSLEPLRGRKVNIIQMIGSLSYNSTPTDPVHIMKQLEQKLNGEAYYLCAPIMVQSKKLKSLMVSDEAYTEIFGLYNKIDVALLEVVSPSFLPPGAKRYSSHLSKADIIQLNELQAISEICGRYFDEDGKTCNTGINERIMAIPMETLKNVPSVIGLASGEGKSKAVLSVLKSRLVNQMVIDETVASQLMAICNE